MSTIKVPSLSAVSSQDALIAERFVDGGSRYSLGFDDADVFRRPYLEAADAGFALLETYRKADPAAHHAALAKGLAGLAVPLLIVWGEDDRYLPKTEAEALVKVRSQTLPLIFFSSCVPPPDNVTPPSPFPSQTGAGRVRLVRVEGAGHLPQEDWPEKVVKAFESFLNAD